MLEQMQPLVVSGLVLVGARVSQDQGLLGLGIWTWAHFLPHRVSGRWLLLVLPSPWQGRGNSPEEWRSYSKSWMKR